MKGKISEKSGPRPITAEKAPSSPVPGRMFEEIKQRAYELHLARNGKPGSALDDWLKAEQEIKARRRIAG